MGVGTLSHRLPNDPLIGKRMAQAIAAVIAVMWVVSLVARMANPERYPIPAEVHYLMGAIVAATFGVTAWIPRRTDRNDPPTEKKAEADA